MINDFISLQNVSVIIANSTLINTNITLHGTKNQSVLIRNCTFRGSQIVIDSVRNCTIESCNFITRDISINEESRHMLSVRNVDSLQVRQTDFLNPVLAEGEEKMNNTHLGIKMDNVSLADIAHCTFRNLKSDSNNGSALLLTSSKVHIRRSRFLSNVAKYGVIFATSYAQITNFDCEFMGNHARHSGGAIYMANNCTLNNMDCTFQNNRAEENGGALYMEQYVGCLNDGSHFINNNAMSGGAVSFRNSANVSILNCIMSNNDASQEGGVLSMWGEVEYSVRNSTFTQNRAELGGVMSVMSRGRQRRVGTITDSRFFHNSADYGGVGYIVDYGDLTIINSTFNHNAGMLFKNIKKLKCTCEIFITVLLIPKWVCVTLTVHFW